MKLKNLLIVVKNLEKSKEFYRNLFGLNVIRDYEGKVVLSEGLVLQSEEIWKNHIKKEIIKENNSSLIYFEETYLENFILKLEKNYPSVKYLDKLTNLDSGQKMIRFYDLDGNLIEIRTPIENYNGINR